MKDQTVDRIKIEDCRNVYIHFGSIFHLNRRKYISVWWRETTRESFVCLFILSDVFPFHQWSHVSVSTHILPFGSWCFFFLTWTTCHSDLHTVLFWNSKIHNFVWCQNHYEIGHTVSLKIPKKVKKVTGHPVTLTILCSFIVIFLKRMDDKLNNNTQRTHNTIQKVGLVY